MNGFDEFDSGDNDYPTPRPSLAWYFVATAFVAMATIATIIIWPVFN